VWENSPFGGHFAYFAHGSSDLRNPIGGFVFDNKITDVWNRTNHRTCLMDGYGYTWDNLSIPVDYKGYLFNFNDRTSSLQVGSLC